MKQFVTILLLVATLGLHAQDKPQNFKGTITNNKADSLIVKSLRGKFRLAVPIDKQGRFSTNIQQGANMFSLIYSDTEIGIFLSNDTDMTLTADAKDFEGTLAFVGEGAKENNLIRKMDNDTRAFEAEAIKTPNVSELKTQADKLTTSWAEQISVAGLSYMGVNSVRMMQYRQKEQLKSVIDGIENRLEFTGKPSPQFSYKDVNGKVVNLSDFKGKYVYIDVWATWCGPCRQEIPHLEKLEESLKGKKIAFVSLSIDKPADTEKWKSMVADKHMGGIQVIAENAWESTFVKAYKIESIPRFILIDPKGNIVDFDAKRPSEPELAAQLEKLMK
ncbi:MAG: TlpA family protein disulfide reductase [Bacteroidia bacterium]